MKKSFSAVVVGIQDTDTSEYAHGAVAIILDVMNAPAPMGSTQRRLTLPLLTREEARELGARYRNGLVRLTIDTETAPPDEQPAADTISLEIRDTMGPLRRIALDVAMGDVEETWKRLTNSLDAPPLVDGRPSCCAEASTYEASLWNEGTHWAITGPIRRITIAFCPFCGARLPAIQAEQP